LPIGIFRELAHLARIGRWFGLRERCLRRDRCAEHEQKQSSVPHDLTRKR
jgi:hypothetical protein